MAEMIEERVGVNGQPRPAWTCETCGCEYHSYLAADICCSD
jgi:hypothetical protein